MFQGQDTHFLLDAAIPKIGYQDKDYLPALKNK